MATADPLDPGRHRRSRQQGRRGMARPLKGLILSGVLLAVLAGAVVVTWQIAKYHFQHNPSRLPALSAPLSPLAALPADLGPTVTTTGITPSSSNAPEDSQLKPTIRVVTVQWSTRNIRPKPTTADSPPLRQVHYGDRVETVALVTGQDPYHDGRDQWLQLTDGSYMWAGTTDAAAVYGVTLPGAP